MFNDFRYAFRSLRKAPGLTAIVVLCIGLGVGANTTIFSLTNAVFLRPLPVNEPERLVRVYSGWDDERNRSASYPEYQSLDQRKEAFDGVAAYRRVRVSVGEGAATTIEDAGLVSGNFFRVVGVTPAEGRFFTEQEDRAPGEYPVIVLTHRFWQTRFDSDPALIGRSVLVSGKPYTVLGVAPAEFTGIEPEASYAFYIPLMTFGHILGADQRFLSQDWHSFHMIGRLKSGVRIERAQLSATAAAQQIGTTYGGDWKGLRFTVMRGGTLANTEESAEISMIFAMLNAVVALVLLIACANVANILLARAMTRRREIAIRLSLGSGRWRLVRQLLSESLVLGLMGGVAGLTLAYWGADLLNLLRLPDNIDTAPDLRVLVYAMSISVVASIIFGVAPALQGTRSAVADALKQGTHLGLPSRSRLRSALVVSQVSLSIVLLVVAGLLLRALLHLRTSEGGYDDRQMIAAELDLTTLNVDEIQGRLIFQDVAERVRRLPGVSAATLSTMVPLVGRQWVTPARSPESEQFRKDGASVDYNIVGSEYFSTLRIPLALGRVLGSTDVTGSPLVTVVNRALANRYWPGQNPIGKTLITSDSNRTWTVVGLAEDARFESRGLAALPHMFVPLQQLYDTNLTLQVRTTAATGEVTGAIRRELQAVHPGLAATFRTFDDIRTEAEFAPRMTATLLSIFGSLALLLAALGLYGVTSYMVAARTHEIGVRMALGARPRGVLEMVARHGLQLAAIGVVIGLAGGIGAGKLISAALVDIPPFDPIVLVTASTVMLAVAFLASLVPARRAANVDPMIALRSE